jgi:hypothetical protein
MKVEYCTARIGMFSCRCEFREWVERMLNGFIIYVWTYIVTRTARRRQQNNMTTAYQQQQHTNDNITLSRSPLQTLSHR